MNGPLSTIAPKWYKSSDVSLIRPRIHNMPDPNTSTQRDQALALLKRRGMTRLGAFSAAGPPAPTAGRPAPAAAGPAPAPAAYPIPGGAPGVRAAHSQQSQLDAPSSLLLRL